MHHEGVEKSMRLWDCGGASDLLFFLAFFGWVRVCMCAHTVDQRRLLAFKYSTEVCHVVLARMCAQQLMSELVGFGCASISWSTKAEH